VTQDSISRLLAEQQQIVCGWCTIPAQLTAEIVQHSGVDVIFVDGQHGMMGWDTVLRLVEGITPGPCAVLVRVPAQDPATIMHALDAGADGVIIPFVNSAEEAANAAGACRYPPSGTRSWGPTRNMVRGDVDTEEANRRVGCVVMLETPAAIGRAGEIAAVPGVDAILIGGNDLALVMSSAERTAAQVRGSEDYRAAFDAVAQACAASGICAGAPCPTPGDATRLGAMGFRLLVIPSDAAMLRHAVGDVVTATRGADMLPSSAAASY
jgi:4-hydroxy-2-oxoheptanedioate aldolase